jgi:hypothetical protein
LGGVIDRVTGDQLYATGGLTLDIATKSSVIMRTSETATDPITSATFNKLSSFRVSNILMNDASIDVKCTDSQITGIVTLDNNSKFSLESLGKVQITTQSFDSATSIKGWSWTIKRNSLASIKGQMVDASNLIFTVSDSNLYLWAHQGIIRRFVNLLGSTTIFETDNDGSDVSEPQPEFGTFEVHIPPPPFGDGCLVDDEAILVQKHPYATKRGWLFELADTKLRKFSYPTFTDFDEGVV